MSGTGRKPDAVWNSFEKIFNVSRKGVRAKCKKCGLEMEGQIIRMKGHLLKCPTSLNEDITGKAFFM